MIMQLKTRNRRFILSLVFVALFFLGCEHSSVNTTKDNLTEDSFREIKAGMTEGEVKKILGEPIRVLEDDEKVQAALHWDSDNSPDEWISEEPDIYEEFYGNQEEMDSCFQKLDDRKKDIVCYEYDYESERTVDVVWHIYFVDEKVIYMYFP